MSKSLTKILVVIVGGFIGILATYFGFSGGNSLVGFTGISIDMVVMITVNVA